MRGKSYIELRDHVNAATCNPKAQIGGRIVLPSTFKGGKRNMHQKYHNAMACMHEHGKPLLHHDEMQTLNILTLTRMRVTSGLSYKFTSNEAQPLEVLKMVSSHPTYRVG